MKLFLVPLLLLACTAPATLTPATGPGSDYPCGVGGKLCIDKGCCSESEDCGGAPGCPAHSCCFFGTERSVDPDAGKRVTPERSPR
jgi:hypothetical protein